MVINKPKSPEACTEGGQHDWLLGTTDDHELLVDCNKCEHVLYRGTDLESLDIYPIRVGANIIAIQGHPSYLDIWEES